MLKISCLHLGSLETFDLSLVMSNKSAFWGTSNITCKSLLRSQCGCPRRHFSRCISLHDCGHRQPGWTKRETRSTSLTVNLNPASSLAKVHQTASLTLDLIADFIGRFSQMSAPGGSKKNRLRKKVACPDVHLKNVFKVDTSH